VKFGKLRPVGKVLDHWQLLHEYEVTGSAITSYAITSPYNVLMISGEGADTSTTVIDECGKAVTCNGGAQIDTAQKKFGASSILFDGTGDYLSLADSADWNFGTQDFTIDCWVRFNDLTNFQTIVSQYEDASNFWHVDKTASSNGNRLRLYFYDGGAWMGRYDMTDAWSGCAANTWYHIAFVRTTTTCKMFIDGVSQTLTESDAFGTNNVGDMSAVLSIGSLNAGSYLNGWLDDIRISKGIARWTSNFTPPLKTTALINGDTDEEYKLLVEMINSTGAGAYAYLRLNNDSAANYGDQNLYGDNATITAIRNTAQGTFYIAYTNAANKLSFAEATIYAKSGYPRTILNTRSESVTGTTVERIRQLGGVWNNSTAPIAALYLFSEGLDVGSKFLLYRKVT